MQGRKVLYLSLVIVLVTFFLITSPAFAIRGPYDDFSGGYLEGDKWTQGQFIREIVSGELRSVIADSKQAWGNNLNQTPFNNNPDTIEKIRANVRVTQMGLGDEDTNMVAAQIEGFFYSSASGDIWAGVFIGKGYDGECRGNDNNLKAWYMIAENYVPVAQGNIGFCGSWQFGDSVEIKIEYDGTQTFAFHVGSYSATGVTGPAFAGDSASPFKSLTTGIWGNADQGGGWAEAYFDNVYVDRGSGYAAYDEFASAPLNSTNWERLEEVRQVTDVGGDYKLRSEIRGVNQSRSMNTDLFYSNAPYVEAKVQVSSGSQFTGSTNKKARARIWGWFFNTKRGPGSGQPYDGRDGDVFVQLALTTYDESGVTKLRAEALADETDR